MVDMLYKSIIDRKNELNLNTRELADLAEVSVPTVQKVERGDDISLANVRAICFALDLIITTIDRSEVAKQELEENLKKIKMKQMELEALETERKALEELINKKK